MEEEFIGRLELFTSRFKVRHLSGLTGCLLGICCFGGFCLLLLSAFFKTNIYPVTIFSCLVLNQGLINNNDAIKLIISSKMSFGS